MPLRAKPEDFDVETMLSYRLSMVYSRIWASSARQLEGFGLALREWRVLSLLGRNDQVSATDLVARSPMDKASVSRAVAKLVADGLVSSTPHPRDRRAQVLRLTAPGRALYRRIAPKSLARQQALLEALTPAERRDIYRILEKLERRSAELLTNGAAAGSSAR